MSRIVIDTGPLWSFALVGELELLGTRLSGRVDWTLAVQAEIARNTTTEPRLKSVLNQSWLTRAR